MIVAKCKTKKTQFFSLYLLSHFPSNSRLCLGKVLVWITGPRIPHGHWLGKSGSCNSRRAAFPGFDRGSGSAMFSKANHCLPASASPLQSGLQSTSVLFRYWFLPLEADALFVLCNLNKNTYASP